MTNELVNFDSMVNLAFSLLLESRFADACVWYDRALRGTGGSDSDRLEARLCKGTSLMQHGRLSEALLQYGEVFTATCERPAYYPLACRALRYQVNVLQRMHQAKGIDRHPKNLRLQLEFIDKSLVWLQGIDRWEWREGFLWHRSVTFEAAGEYRQALDQAEESYSLARRPEARCGYCLCDHAVRVARCARLCGMHQRGLKVLDEVLGDAVGPLDHCRTFTERAAILRTMLPANLLGALDAAREGARYGSECQNRRERLFAFAELAVDAVEVNSMSEALDALHALCETALKEEGIDQSFLLRQAASALRQAEAGWLEGERGPQDEDYGTQLGGYRQQIQEALLQHDSSTDQTKTPS